MDTGTEMLLKIFVWIYVIIANIIRFTFWKELRPDVDSKIKGIPLYILWDAFWAFITINNCMANHDDAVITGTLLVLYTMRGTQKMQTVDIKNQMVSEEYERLNKMNLEMQYLRHDMKNHLLAIGSMVDNQKYDELKMYIGDLQAAVVSNHTDMISGNSMIDAILKQKTEDAKEKQINVQVNCDYMAGIKVSDKDICIIMANLYDNTIEAATYVKENPWIRINIARNGDMLMMKFSNNYVKKPRKILDKYISGKKDSELHGYGLLSVRNALKKYDGDLDIEYDGGKFTATVTIFDGFEG